MSTQQTKEASQKTPADRREGLAQFLSAPRAGQETRQKTSAWSNRPMNEAEKEAYSPLDDLPVMFGDIELGRVDLAETSKIVEGKGRTIESILDIGGRGATDYRTPEGQQVMVNGKSLKIRLTLNFE